MCLETDKKGHLVSSESDKKGHFVCSVTCK